MSPNWNQNMHDGWEGQILLPKMPANKYRRTDRITTANEIIDAGKEHQ